MNKLESAIQNNHLASKIKNLLIVSSLCTPFVFGMIAAKGDAYYHKEVFAWMDYLQKYGAPEHSQYFYTDLYRANKAELFTIAANVLLGKNSEINRCHKEQKILVLPNTNFSETSFKEAILLNGIMQLRDVPQTLPLRPTYYFV